MEVSYIFFSENFHKMMLAVGLNVLSLITHELLEFFARLNNFAKEVVTIPMKTNKNKQFGKIKCHA